MANVSRPMQAVPQLLLDSTDQDIGEPLKSGLESVRQAQDRWNHDELPEPPQDFIPNADSMQPTTEENIRTLLQLIKGKPAGQPRAPEVPIRRRRRPELP